MALPFYSLMLPAVILIISLVSFPYISRVLRRHHDPPITGLDLWYSGKPDTCKAGLEVEPDAVKAKFDIVAVHGLGAHPLYTWTKKRRIDADTQVPNEESDRINWLKELLPRKFSGARVMNFAHNADWFFRAPQKISPESARDLLFYLKEKRKDIKDFTPIIFVAHSFGGVIVKDAFIAAKLQASRDSEAAEILKATCGIIFLGTPHQGAELSKLATWIAALTGPLLGSNSSLPRSIAYHSAYLDDKHLDFSDSYGDNTLLYSLYETLDTFFFGVNVGKIVERSSASLRSKNAQSMGIDKDHSGLAKFNNMLDPAMRKILMIMNDLLNHSKSSSYFRENTRHAVLNAVRLTKESTIKEFHLHKEHFNKLPRSSATRHSVEWFLSSLEYANWSSWDNPVSQFLWFKGKPRIGKSMTCASIVHRLCETLDKSTVQDVAFFFCFRNCTPSDVILSILAQIASRDERRIHALDSESQHLLLAAYNPDYQPDLTQLWDLLERIIRIECGRNIYLIIDGIDKIHPEMDRSLFANRLHHLWKAIRLEKSPLLNCLVTSLPYAKLGDAFDGLDSIDPATEILECLGSLLPLASNYRQNTVTVAEQRTGNWVYDEPQFKDWLRADSTSTLWLCGKPGSGKSTLLRKVMQEFQDELHSPDLTAMLGGKTDMARQMNLEKHLNFEIGKKAIVASFFYSSRVHHRKPETSHVHMLQSLLYQLLKQEEDLFPVFRKTYIELRDLYNSGDVNRHKRHHVLFEWPFESLLSILRNVLNHRSRSCVLYIFVDAMDESNSEGKWDVLSLLTQTQAIEPQKLKADYKIVLEDHNSNDIVCLVNSKVDLFMELTPPNEIAYYEFQGFKEQVICRADGVILWVSLVLSVTQTLFEDGPPPPDDMMQNLNSLPDDLEDLYVAIVDRLKSIPANVEKGRKWLKWAAFSARPLELDEFRDAIAVAELDSQYDGNPEKLGPKQFGSSFKTAESNLRRICGGFVELKNLRFSTLLQSIQPEQLASTTAIQLLHQTVKRFLQKQKAIPFQSLKPQGDLLIARSCSRYLLSLSERCFLFPVGIKQAMVWELLDYECLVRHLEKRPLLSYVFTFLPYHIQCLESRRELDTLGQIIEDISTNPVARYLIASWADQIRRDCDQIRGQQRIIIPDPKQWLHFWSQQPKIHLSEHEKVFLPKFITRAIVFAVKAHSFAAVKALVAAGATVDIADDLSASSALDVAAAEGHSDIYSYLSRYTTSASAIQDPGYTNSSSDLRPPSDRFGSSPAGTKLSANVALCAAAKTGNLSQLRWMLDTGAEPDGRDDHGLSAVHWAAAYGKDEIVKLLVKAGADVNSKDNQGKTPFMLAAENGHIDATRILLESGADPALKSNSGDTPFSLAFANNHKAVTQLLHEVETVGGRTNIEPRSIFMVPFSRNKDFVGRESIFMQITQLLQVQDHRPVVLIGLGGIGKSAIAVEYAYRFVDQSPAKSVFWAYAQSETRLKQSFEIIAKATKMPGWDDKSVDVMQRIPRWLSRIKGYWLLVIDDLDDIGLLRKTLGSSAWQSLFRCSLGQIMITSRTETIARLLTANVIILEPLSILEGSALMKQIIEIEDDEKITELLEALGCLPLAVIQAAAFMVTNSITVSEFFALFNESDSNRVELLSWDNGNSKRDRSLPNSVVSTFMISLQQITLGAFDLLSLMSLLDRQKVPAYLVSLLFPRRVHFHKAVRNLQAHSLVQANSDRHFFSVHQLVQAMTRQWLQSQGSLTDWMEKSVELIFTAFPSGNFANWGKCAELLPHAKVVLQYRLQGSFHQIKRAAILNRIGEYEMSQGQYKPAEDRIEAAATIQTRLLGSEHPDTLASTSNLALVWKSQGRYEEAEQMHRQTLPLKRKILGNEHPDTLLSMVNLSEILFNKGMYKEAEQMGRETLQRMEKVLGKEHPHTLMSMNNLGVVLSSQNNYEYAESMHRETLHLREIVLGQEHPDTLSSMSNLGMVYYNQGKSDEAETMQQRVLELEKVVLGNEHPDTLTSMNNLAIMLDSQGKSKEAEMLHRQVLEVREKVLGNQHPSTLTSMGDLAMMLYHQKKFKEAETMQQRALDLQKRVLGHEHPDTLASMNNLASILDTQGKSEEAMMTYRQLLDLREKVLGAEHPDTLNTANCLEHMLNRGAK